MRRHNENNSNYVENIIAAFKENMNNALRTHNLPTSRSDVAAVFEGAELPFQVNLRLYTKEREIRHQIKNLNSLIDPMVYPILFPYGKLGFELRVQHTNAIGGLRLKLRTQHTGIIGGNPAPIPVIRKNKKQNDNDNVDDNVGEHQPRDKRKYVTIREFYKYRLQIRDHFSILHNAGTLFQQYVIDA